MGERPEVIGLRFSGSRYGRRTRRRGVNSTVTNLYASRECTREESKRGERRNVSVPFRFGTFFG